MAKGVKNQIMAGLCRQTSIREVRLPPQSKKNLKTEEVCNKDVIKSYVHIRRLCMVALK